jgi:phospholipid transport system substrate-binding protein
MQSLKQIKTINIYTVIFVLAGLFMSAIAQAEEGPHDLVKKTASNLVKALTDDPAKLKDNPAAYEKIVKDILVPAIDFVTISKRVMGKTHYLASSPEQRSKFQSVFKESLVSTYSSGLAIFDSQEIKVFDPTPGTEGNAIQAVNMEVKAADGTVFPLRFTMRKDDSGAWKVVNVVLNGVNIAKAYNSHFSESMIKHNGNVDQLIAGWNAKIVSDEEITNALNKSGKK